MTKKFLMAICAVVVLASCSTKTDGYELNAALKGDVENGTNVYLRTLDSLNQLMDVDTTQVQEGSFTFAGKQDIPHLHYLAVDGLPGTVPVILENGDISVKFQKDSLQFAEVKGTLQNDLFMDFLRETRTISDMGRSLQDDFRNASANRDTAAVESLREEFFELQEKMKTFNIDFVKENPDALISALVLENLMRTKAIPFDEAQTLYDGLNAEVKNTKPGKSVQEQLKNSKSAEVGQRAPEFSAPTPTGDLLALGDIKSKVTLIDFWAAWCRPCRMENPNIVSIYEKYKDKGLNVVGVSLDTKAEDWIKAIENDGLAWNHVSHLKRFDDPIAKLYNVNAIPAAFLLDENGVIVAKNLRGPDLEEKVAELLN